MISLMTAHSVKSRNTSENAVKSSGDPVPGEIKDANTRGSRMLPSFPESRLIVIPYAVERVATETQDAMPWIFCLVRM